LLQISGGADDNDVADEKNFLMESMEMQYNVAEVIGELFRTHGHLYYDQYMTVWHLIIETMTPEHCLIEDRRFAFFVISDVIEFGLSEKFVSSYFESVIPRVCEGCEKTTEAGIRQTCAFILGVAAKRHPHVFSLYCKSALQALAASVSMGENPPVEMRGAATDNAVASIGIILEEMDSIGIPLPYDSMWRQWIAYLPLQHDKVL
jgi:hypothetical protein